MKAGHFNFVKLILIILVSLLALGYSYQLTPWSKKSLRQIGWLKMISLSFIWSFTTTIFPLLILPENMTNPPDTMQMIILFIHRFFFIAALSFLFNIIDYEEDKKDGIKTIAVLLGPQKSIQYGKWIMIFANTLTVILLLYFFNLNHPIYFAALIVPDILLFLLYHRFSAKTDEVVFAIRHDGLMIIKALLLIFAVLTIS
jgi:4-hydroxybenzoate polyprenyltransferase